MFPSVSRIPHSAFVRVCAVVFMAFPSVKAASPVLADLPPLPADAKLALEENWSTGSIDPSRWYVPRKKWGNGNAGVSPENVAIRRDVVNGREQPVLVCTAHGDLYDGEVNGYEGRRTRVGGVIVSREFFASGRFEVVMKIGSTSRAEGGPEDPTRPKGAIPAVWTYAYRYVTVPKEGMDVFHPNEPLYNPHMKAYKTGANEYWSEIDFPEFGKGGDFGKALYNTFLQNRHQSRVFNVEPVIDGQYHTLTTEWRTKLVPIDGVTDAQVAEKDGYHWVQDPAIPFNRYLGNPLKRLAKDRYAIYSGDRAIHYIDGRKVGENPTFVPSMSAQLNLGVWLPDWAGPAPWKQADVSFASVKIWRYHDEGDAYGILTKSLSDNFAADGTPIKR
jgi:hypothetical protein